ncbi:MAG: 4Fe-4S binding protein [Proteobacteria bacterium]|nr:4Fe-4S binding protein [Pseudomonadota bacterium]
MTPRNRAILVSVTCLGMSSLITQIVTLREFLNVLAGNELVIGLVLGNWLLLTGLGSFLGRYAGRLQKPVRWLVVSQVAIAILPLLQISGIRLLKKLFVPGLMLGLNETFLFSLLLLLPYCTLSGFLLTLFSGLGGTRKDEQQIGDIYVLDVIGDIIGGLLFSFCLIFFFSPFQVLTFLLVLNFSAAILVVYTEHNRRAAAPVILLMTLSLLSIAVFDLEKMTGQAMFQGQQVIFQEATPYGNLAVTRSEEQYTVYEGGVPVGSTQNVIAAEETVHYAMSQHPDPKMVLLVSGGLNGALAEILKYKVDTVDYVELDPAVIDLVKRFSPATDDQRISLLTVDARKHVKSAKDLYDAILVDLADPSTAQLNRFYTVEFFKEVRNALRDGGVFSFSLSGAENYANPEMRYLSSTVYRSLTAVFPNIIIIPGDQQFYIASTEPLDYKITDRLAAKNIETSYVKEEYLSARLTKDRLAAAREMISIVTPLNLDFRPASYFSLLNYWLSKFQSSLLLPLFIGFAIILTITFLLLQAKRRAPPLALCLSGFSGMGLEIVILIAFQVCYGFVYKQLGIIITAFLLGTAVGGAWSVRRIKVAQVLMIRLDVLLGLFAFLLGPILVMLQTTANPVLQQIGPIVIFPGLTTLIGFLVGAQFPAAAKLTFSQVEETAGTLYGLDFLGAALGAMMITAFVIPMIGITATCYFIGGLKLFSAAVLWWRREPVYEETVPPVKKDISPQFVYGSVLLCFGALGFLGYWDKTSMTIYAFSFFPTYHWIILALLALGIMQAMQLPAVSIDSRSFIKTFDLKIFERTRLGLFRWIGFISFSLVAFLPIFRCYFKVPYLFCHVCPRQCIFGYMRSYLVPAALIMNINKRYWCFHLCPIGTLFDCQARISGKAWHLPRWLKTVPILILLFTAVAYFKISSDLAHPADTLFDWYTVLFKNTYSPTLLVILIALLLLILAFRIRRSFCEMLCPVGTLSNLILKFESLPFKNELPKDTAPQKKP